jgi:hypothetical protein
MSDRDNFATLVEYRRKAAFYRDHAAKAGTPIDREYWLRIAKHWRDMAAGSDGDCDDQVN